jgi:hypothetical protein
MLRLPLSLMVVLQVNRGMRRIQQHEILSAVLLSNSGDAQAAE